MFPRDSFSFELADGFLEMGKEPVVDIEQSMDSDILSLGKHGSKSEKMAGSSKEDNQSVAILHH